MKQEDFVDKQTGKSYEVVPEGAWDVVVAVFSILYLVVVLVICTCLFFATWTGYSIEIDDPKSPVFLIMVYAVIGGGLGGTINGIRSFIGWHAERKAFNRRYVWKYISQPLIGVALATMVYALFRSGIVTLGGNFTPDDNFTNQVLAAFGIGAITGYGSRRTLIWLDNVVKKVFGIEIKIPDVKGMTLEEAKAVLEKHNLVLGNISKEASDDPDTVDKVIKQNPLAGSTGKADEKVDITIATKK